MTEATTEELRSVRGPNFETIARLPMEGRKRKKCLAIIAAYADAGRSATRAEQIAQHLGLSLGATMGLLERLKDDGLATRTKGRGGKFGRWRLADHLSQPAPKRSKKRRRTRMSDTNGGHGRDGGHQQENAQNGGLTGEQASERGTALSGQAA